MTTFDWYVLGSLPVVIILVIIQLALNDWSIEKMMFKEDK